MATVVHEDLYKHKGKNISEIKFATKTTVKIDQSRQRDRMILSKRFKIESLEEVEVVLSAQEELEKVKNATKLLKQGKKVDALTILRRCFARDPSSSKSFLRNDGLQTLQSCLLSTDVEVLQAAACCLVNLSACTSLNVNSMAQISSLIIQFMQGTDPQMQELCAWAVGNFAGDSHKHRELLLKQGCIAPLVTLVSSEYHLSLEARSQSVLFALVNLARDNDYSFIRCMLDNSLFDHLELMLRTIDESCDFFLEMGWLCNLIYSRQETYLEHEDHYNVIVLWMITKLSQIREDKIILPYLHCLGNMIGLSPLIALIASTHHHFLQTLYFLLTSDIEFIQKESLWVLGNFIAEPSCRVQTILHTGYLKLIFERCQSADEEIALSALYLLDAASKVSSYICQFLIQRETASILVKLLNDPRQQIQEAALDILIGVITGATVQGKTTILNADQVHQLQSLASSEKCGTVMDKAKCLLTLL